MISNEKISRNRWRDSPKFRKIPESIWLTVIYEIFKLPPFLDPFCEINYSFELPSGYPSYPIQKKNAFGLDPRLLERDFVNYSKPYD